MKSISSLNGAATSPFGYRAIDLPRRVVVRLIVLYQCTISPDHGWFVRWRFPYGYCRFHPSCSEYARRVIYSRGVIRGIPLAAWRVLRCNPCARGGVDEPHE